MIEPMIAFGHEERIDGAALVVIGEIDMSTVPAFRHELDALTAAAHSPARLTLDILTSDTRHTVVSSPVFDGSH